MNLLVRFSRYMEDKKYIAKFVLIIIVFGAVFAAINTSKVNLSKDTIKISGMYGMNIDISEIEEASVKESLPSSLQKNNGINFFELAYIGNFYNSDLGKIKMFVSSTKGPYLYITLSNGDYRNIIIGLKDKDKLRTIYSQINNQNK